MIKKLRSWHGKKISEIQDKFGLTNYQILLISFIEGIIIGIIIGYIVFG